MTIWEAAQSGDFEALRAELAASPSLLNAASADGWTALHLAAHFGHASLAAYLIAIGADPLARSANTLANLPVHAAAAGRHAGIVALLLAAGTPVDATQHGGYTALHAAANAGDLATVEVLLKAGADPALPAENGLDAKGFAQKSGHGAVVERLG
ncbi:MAG: ankyrin repeat domain-containing protein [Bryobacteraceae bacterium]|nr:ankyrin repeat domain-containing protein [Bryobacteraceae bacterium]